MRGQPTRRPGDRIIRRRLQATQVIELPAAPERPTIPNVRRHAKLFALALLALVVICGGLLTLPVFSRNGEWTPFVDAVFTSTSAATVTGLVVVDTANHWNIAGQVLILALIQAGGLGFMVGANLLLRALQRSAAGLRETLLLQDGAPTLSLREAAELSGQIVRFTLFMEGIGAVVLATRFAFDYPIHLAVWYGIFHAISAFCNAGFDLQGGFRSVSGYQDSIFVNVMLMILIQAGSLSYLFFADIAIRRRFARLALETKIILLMNALMLVLGASIFLGAEWNASLSGVPVVERPLVALFQSVSARTAGFATINFDTATNITLFTWVAIMFVGGASGSTAGGVKLTTVGVVGLAVVSTVRGQLEPQVFGRRIPTTLIFRAMAVIAIMFAAHFVATLGVVISEHQTGGDVPFIAILVEAMSALAPVGVSTGIAPALSDPAKIVLCATMFFGRLGPLTAVYALQIRQHVVRYKFPEALVRIG